MAYKKKTGKKQKLKIDRAVAHITSSFNNTLVSITTMTGDVVLRSSCGMLGHKGSRKSTAFAASQVAYSLAREMIDRGIRSVEVNLSGPGPGRDSVPRALQASGLDITVLRDVTPLPHNGCRAPKKARN